MGKPGKAALVEFKELFDRMSRNTGKEQFLTYYLIAAYPGCTDQDMLNLKRFASQKLKVNPEQVQIFTPTPSTYATTMYYTEMDPFTREPIFVEKAPRRKERQKEIVVRKGDGRGAKRVEGGARVESRGERQKGRGSRAEGQRARGKR